MPAVSKHGDDLGTPWNAVEQEKRTKIIFAQSLVPARRDRASCVSWHASHCRTTGRMQFHRQHMHCVYMSDSRDVVLKVRRRTPNLLDRSSFFLFIVFFIDPATCPLCS